MAKGETVAALYTKLGLDLSSLSSDFALAGKTVDQAISRINHENKKIRIEADIDLSKLDGAKDKARSIDTREQALIRQLDLQRQKIRLVATAYREMVQAKGADSAASARLETRLLNERKAYANLEVQLRAVRKERSAQTSIAGRMVNSVANGAGAMSVLAQGAGDLGLLGFMSGPIGKAVGVTTAVSAGLIAMAKSAMTAGNNIYGLAQRMHTTNAEAARMNMVFKLAGADASAAVPAIIRLDKAIQSAGEDGNDTTRLLSAFGVVMKDSAGNLLPVNQQLAALAKGYRNAAAAGLESEFVSQLLGARGAELVPVLKDMAELQERAAKIPTTGLLNPDEAHRMNMEWNEMKVSMGQLSGAIGAAFMPVVSDLMPDVNEAIETLVKSIKDNKSDIESVVKTIGSIGGVAVDACKLAGEAFDGLGINMKNAGAVANFIKAEIKDCRETLADMKETLGDTALADGISRLWNWAMADYMPKDAENPKEQEAKKSEASQSAEETRRKVEEAMAKAKKASSGEAGLTDEIYKLTHSDLENQLHDIDLKAEKLKSEGAKEADIVRYTEAAKAKVMRDFNEGTLSQINKSWKSELQNRLDDIDREKKAWIQKGVDEVTATRWAEREKTKARQQEALSMLKENRQYLEIMRQAMAGEGDTETRMNNAKMAVLMAMRKKYGIQNDMTSPEEVSRFAELMNSVKNNLVPGLETDLWAKRLGENTIPVYRGSEMNRDIPGFTANVTIQGGTYMDESGMKKMADNVADRIKVVYADAARRSQLAYGGA